MRQKERKVHELPNTESKKSDPLDLSQTKSETLPFQILYFSIFKSGSALDGLLAPDPNSEYGSVAVSTF